MSWENKCWRYLKIKTEAFYERVQDYLQRNPGDFLLRPISGDFFNC